MPLTLHLNLLRMEQVTAGEHTPTLQGGVGWLRTLGLGSAERPNRV
jgi:hypothetical protein